MYVRVYIQISRYEFILVVKLVCIECNQFQSHRKIQEKNTISEAVSLWYSKSFEKCCVVIKNRKFFAISIPFRKMIVKNCRLLKNTGLSIKNVAARTFATQVAAQVDLVSNHGHTTNFSNAIPYSKVPGPSALSFILANRPGGKLHTKDLQEMFAILREEYGDLVKMPSVLGKPAIVVSHNPEHFQTILRTEGAWPDRLVLQSLQFYRTKMRPDIYGKYQGLLNTNGKEWGDFRTAVNPVVIQPKTVKHYIPTIDKVAGDFLKRIRQIRNPTTYKLPEDFQHEMNKWTLESIGVIALDTRLGLLTGELNIRATEFMKAVAHFIEHTFALELKPSIWRIFPTAAFKAYMKALDTLTNIASEYINEARIRIEAQKSSSTGDHEQSVLEKLLKIDENIATVMALDMVFAGVDTTSSAFTSVLYPLAKNPDKQEILRREIMFALPEKDSSFTPETMRNLPYLRACVKEGQRILPTVNGFMRNAGQDIVLDGYQIPKNTSIIMNSTPLKNDDKHYQEASKFIPERWLKQGVAEGKCPVSVKSVHPFINLPFGFGPRMCIGKRFAEMEIEIMVAKIIRNFYVSWELPDLTFKCSAVRLPKGKLMYTLKDVEK